MNTKKIATAFLILFVVASVGTIVAKERGAQPAPEAEVTPGTEIVAAQPPAPTEQQPVSAAPMQAENVPSTPSAPVFMGNTFS